MNIRFKERMKATFDCIIVGECFKYDNEIFLKIRTTSSDDNVFNFTSYKVMTIYRSTMVEPLNMTLVEE